MQILARTHNRRRMLENLRNSKLTPILSILLMAVAALSFTPMVHAYGAANWQVGFAGTFVTPGSGSGGFWGWCDFAGGTGSPAASGTDADCQTSVYFGPTHTGGPLQPQFRARPSRRTPSPSSPTQIEQ